MALDILPEARKNLAAIKAENREAWAELVAFLKELLQDWRLVAKLIEKGAWGTPSFIYDTTGFRHFQNLGYDVWRVKLLPTPIETNQYRIIYTIDPNGRNFYVLAFMHRSRNYEQDADLVGQVERGLKSLGVIRPTYH